MPKESRMSLPARQPVSAPYPTPTSAGLRNAAIWNAADDTVLIQARASGLNWQPIAATHFPNKTANACRKRHERLMERRNIDDWDATKLNLLAQGYLTIRKEMWEMLAVRLGERWSVVEAKCMEKGLKTLQATARTAQRKNNADPGQAFDDQTTTDHHSDSGIGFGSGSDAEMEAEQAELVPVRQSPDSWRPRNGPRVTQSTQDHSRSRSLPQLLPLYRPPPPPPRISTQFANVPALDSNTTSPATLAFHARNPEVCRLPPNIQNNKGALSIQSMLSPAEPSQY